MSEKIFSLLLFHVCSYIREIFSLYHTHNTFIIMWYIHIYNIKNIPNSIVKISIRAHLIYTPYVLYIREHLYLSGTQVFYHSAHLSDTLKFRLKHTKKEHIISDVSSYLESHYSICLLSASSLKSFSASMKSYNISSGRYMVLPFK